MAGSNFASNAPETAKPASISASPDTHLLDNPIWNALCTEHASLALGTARARRYPPSIGPLAGIVDTSAESYEALRELTNLGGVAGLFLDRPYSLQPGWTLKRDGRIHQMICLDPVAYEPAQVPQGAEFVHLTAADVPEMVALATLTEPGPFNERTMELGTFFGIRSGGRLLAMAGERQRWPNFVEVSAVCTHPDARGRGYGSLLTATVAARIQQCGETPVLHVYAANQSAVRVYESLGFTLRRTLEFALLKNGA
jgi:ribosomal protein S18 acetylase RimI-like enzyme